MISSATPSRIELSDPALESEQILHNFLDVIINGASMDTSE